MYVRPETMREAVGAMAGGSSLVLAGGTDVYPAYVGRPLGPDIVDVSNLREMRGISEEGGYHRIGAATTWTDIVRADLPPAFDGLKLAAREVGSVQIQNRGTIGGNLCNASPAADGVPPLLTLDAEVELVSAQGVRRMALAMFIAGYRRTEILAHEILSAILVPKLDNATASFVKLGARRYLVISIVMVAAVLQRDGRGRIVDARVAVGAASAVAQRLPELERGLVGQTVPSAIVAARHIAALSPVDDVRATASYRNDAALHLIARTLNQAAGLA